MKYLSYSRMIMWERSPKEYARVYILGGKSFQNPEMVFGSKVAQALETKKPTGDEAIDSVLARLPKLEMADEMTTTKVVGLPIRARMDAANKDLKTFYEYKTGKVPWTQARVDKFDQITFYAMVCWSLTGAIPEDMRLIWVQTAGEGEEVTCTGVIKEFKTARTMMDVLRMIRRVQIAWQEIQELELSTLL